MHVCVGVCFPLCGGMVEFVYLFFWMAHKMCVHVCVCKSMCGVYVSLRACTGQRECVHVGV